MDLKGPDPYSKDFVYSFVLKEYDDLCLDLKEEFGVEAMKEFMRNTQDDDSYDYMECFYETVYKWQHIKSS